MLRPLLLATLFLTALLWGLLTMATPATFTRALAQTTAQTAPQAASELSVSSVLSVGTPITVTTVADGLITDGYCSLREALQAAETNATVDSCPAGNGPGDGGDTLYLPAGTYELTSGEITLTGHITLQGSLSATTILDAKQLGRVIYITSTAVVMLSHLDIRNGLLPVLATSWPDAGPIPDPTEMIDGGGVLNLGTATLAHSVIHDNKAGGGGRTEFGDIGRGGDGGGIFNNGVMTITNSTVSGNHAGDGTTAVGDDGQSVCGTPGKGGGIANVGNLTLDTSTVAYNIPGKYCVGSPNQPNGYDGNEGGLFSNIRYASPPREPATLTVKNSIIADNIGNDCSGTLTSLGNNLIRKIESCTITGDNIHWLSNLEALADNGGPTLTHALDSRSRAIDAGNCTDSNGEPITTDQRGVARPQHGGCDIGAYESPYTYTFAILTTTLPTIAFESPACVADTPSPCNLTHHPADDSQGIWSPDGEHIAFVRERYGSSSLGTRGIYVMNADGTNVTLLAPDGSEPKWSPDGTKIAYTSYLGGVSEIYLVAATSGTPINLTNGATPWNYRARWSPDSSTIVYNSRVNTTTFDVNIYAVRADGSHNVLLGEKVNFWGWSPDSSRVALGTSSDDSFYTIAPDGSNQVNYDSSPSTQNHSPSWSPDGTKIAYVCVHTTPIYQSSICIANKDGSNRQVHHMDALELDKPMWSPNAAMLAFSCGDALCTMRSDGSNRQRFGTGDKEVDYALWSPDGSWIAFTCGGALCTMRGDGSQMHQLTEKRTLWLQWSPVENTLFFAAQVNESFAMPYDFYVINPDSTNLQWIDQVETSDFTFSFPTWSPDGSRILYNQSFVRHVHNDPMDLFVYWID